MHRTIAKGTVIAAIVLFLEGMCGLTNAWEYGVLDDFHLSVRDEFDDEGNLQIDNYFAMDVYRLMETVDFHSAFHITNDLNLLDTEAIQLTSAYLSLNQLLGRLDLDVGRQFFVEGFDAFLGDGIRAEYRISKPFVLSGHFAFPFDAENEAIDHEPMHVYGFALDVSGRRGGTLGGYRASAQVERRERTDIDGLDQTLLGVEGLVELAWPIDNDVYADFEYEAEAAQMRRMKIGSELYLSPVFTLRVEGQRYHPDQRKINEQYQEFLTDAILNSFSNSEVWSARVAAAYLLPGNRELSVAYSGQRYTERSGNRTFGSGINCFFTFLSAPNNRASLGAGYSGMIGEEESFHLGILRTFVDPLPRLHLSLDLESGVMDTHSWDGSFVLSARAGAHYLLRPNLQVTGLFEENRNPYFESDLRGIFFVRYFWAARVR